ncbi:MAG TPA: molybdopterin-dependent oxidoreductase [Rhizomicrobium sp.]|nr:molybdopterin-dependent oxidoreductase [Rhizomicrobium sp.]
MTRPRLLTSRRAILGGLVGAGSLAVSGCTKSPPTYGDVLRMGDNFTYQAHRLLLPANALVRVYSRQDITSMPATGTTDPSDPKGDSYDAKLGPLYRRDAANAFDGWRLSVEGAVARPGSYSLDFLKRLPAQTQITRHTCEEGWTAIAEWTGARLSALLQIAGARANARFVHFHTYDAQIDSIDMVEALHPQTLLAYGMNGRDLPISHGAPVRLRVERQIGYKSMKFLRRIVVSENFIDPGAAGPIQSGWAWYTGI